ncbi:MAG: hypothetical protein F4Z62_13005 [Rhodothermaceae bacterium]|nr:hypothetical protein [Rhodothermaceae bacterium]
MRPSITDGCIVAGETVVSLECGAIGSVITPVESHPAIRARNPRAREAIAILEVIPEANFEDFDVKYCMVYLSVR